MEDILDKIADGIAEQGYAIVDNFIDPETVQQILVSPEYLEQEHFKRAGTGKAQDKLINEAIRGDYIRWLDRKTASLAVSVYLKKLDELMLFLNRSLYLSLKDYEIHVTTYPIGTFYKRHLDQFKKDDHRKLSAILYLNQYWIPEHGGSLRMYFSDRHEDILPIAGRLVCFRSDQVEHEVLPATRERHSITGWLLDHPAGFF